MKQLSSGADKKNKVRLRFPPSPTGHFHIGGVRTALFNWLFARKNGGDFILRIEDTDKIRSNRKYEIEITETLKWLGLEWDEGIDWKLINQEWQTFSKGDYGPYRQSERENIYKKYLEKLIDDKKAYFCYCTKEELIAERQAMLAQGLPPKYSGHCRNLKEPPPNRYPNLIRIKNPGIEIEFRDLIRGKVRFDTGLFGDFPIARDLTSPLYNFAVVVDDYEMKISHVIRGEEHLSNTPKQILLQKILGFDEPVYGHLPLILNPDRSKLSKRYTDTSILEYREKGYLPEAIINFLALLGWHPPGDREKFSLNELIEEFSIKRVQKSGAIFDQEKLLWLNSEYIRKLSTKEISERIKPILKEEGIKASKSFLEKVVSSEKERAKTLYDFVKIGGFFFKLPDYQTNLLLWKNNSLLDTKETLEEIMDIFEAIDSKSFKKENIVELITPVIEKRGRGSVLWPLRVAVSGQQASPDPIEIVEILGKEETIKRIKNAINKIGLAI